MRVNREDMLELTRRMTIARNCFGRIAGGYMDGEGYVDGTFNTHFQKLSGADKTKNLRIAKAVPFSETNRQLKGFRFRPEGQGPGSVWQLLMALRECEGFPYGIYVFHGNYDIPLKGSDKVQQRESEEIYSFLVCAICPVDGDYEAGEPQQGFLFPAFSDRAGDIDGIDVFSADGNPEALMALLF